MALGVLDEPLPQASNSVRPLCWKRGEMSTRLLRAPDKRMSTESNRKPTLFALAFPSILANLLFSAVVIVQIRFIGELGTEALAAINVGQRVFFALQALLMAVSAGTTALVARAWGAGDSDEASRVVMVSIVTGAAFALAMTATGMLAAKPVASVFGLDAATTELAAVNIRWMSAFNLAFAVNLILGAALRAAGDAWSPLWIGAGVNVVNVPLLYLFIFGHYGFPRMGVAGAALAGGISFTIGAAVMATIWLRQGFRVKHVRNKWFRRERLRQLLRIGGPAGLEMLVFQAGHFLFLILIGHYYGTTAFAAYGVGQSLLMVCFVVGFGFSIASATLTGQHLGAGDATVAARSGWRSAAMATACVGSLGLAIALFAPELTTFFLRGDRETARLTTVMVYMTAAMTPFLAIEFAIGGALRGAGDTRFPLIATAVGLLGVRCVLAATFTALSLPVEWVFGALMGEFVVKGAMLVARFRSKRWHTAIRDSAPRAPKLTRLAPLSAGGAGSRRLCRTSGAAASRRSAC